MRWWVVDRAPGLAEANSPLPSLEGRRQGRLGRTILALGPPPQTLPVLASPGPHRAAAHFGKQGHLVLSRMGLSALGTPHPHHSRLYLPRPRSSALPQAAHPGLGAVAGLLSTASCGAERAEVTQEGTLGVELGGCADTSRSNHTGRGGVLELEDGPVVRSTREPLVPPHL